ncbi:hypothetical protein H5410_024049 [Solanum commersonii]|uniref:Uncharacterized protein n=1 Tax=Solanum commersonii TaxID=4109 RepID=A0A9J5ZKX0_SOLCO|nr:hypothetical protein H5410_024049 [Solanum commersonii]
MNGGLDRLSQQPTSTLETHVTTRNKKKANIVKEKVEALKAEYSSGSNNGGMVVVCTRSCCASCNGRASFQDEKEERMLKKVGAFSKDPTPYTCVTVCGVSELDACARTVCVNQHQVPNWNDICLKRCQSECLRLSQSSVVSS